MEPILNPPIPFTGTIPGGFVPGRMVRVQGTASPVGKIFNVNLQCGQNTSKDDFALNLSVRILEGVIIRNSLQSGIWGDEQRNGTSPIGSGQKFEIIILCDPNEFKVAVNGQHFCEFPQRIPFSRITNLAIDGDVSINLVAYEAISPVVTQPPGPNSAQDTSTNVAQTEAFGPASAPYSDHPGGYGNIPYMDAPPPYGGSGPTQYGNQYGGGAAPGPYPPPGGQPNYGGGQPGYPTGPYGGTTLPYGPGPYGPTPGPYGGTTQPYGPPGPYGGAPGPYGGTPMPYGPPGQQRRDSNECGEPIDCCGCKISPGAILCCACLCCFRVLCESMCSDK